MRFTSHYEAGYHCQLGAFALSFAREYDWLDATLGLRAASRRENHENDVGRLTRPRASPGTVMGVD